MTIRLNTGKEFEASTLTQSLRDTNRILVEVKDKRPLSQIAADFEGVTTIERVPEGKSLMKETWSGLETLVGVTRVDEATVRLTIEGSVT